MLGVVAYATRMIENRQDDYKIRKNTSLMSWYLRLHVLEVSPVYRVIWHNSQHQNSLSSNLQGDRCQPQFHLNTLEISPCKYPLELMTHYNLYKVYFCSIPKLGYPCITASAFPFNCIIVLASLLWNFLSRRSEASSFKRESKTSCSAGARMTKPFS